MSLYRMGLVPLRSEVRTGATTFEFWEHTLSGVASGLILFLFFLFARRFA